MLSSVIDLNVKQLMYLGRILGRINTSLSNTNKHKLPHRQTHITGGEHTIKHSSLLMKIYVVIWDNVHFSLQNTCR